MPDINDLKASAEKLAQQARETAELGVQVARDQIHSLVKDPEVLRRMEEVEETFDRQMQDVSRRIEDGANQMFTMLNNLMAQAPFPAANRSAGTPEPHSEETHASPKD